MWQEILLLVVGSLMIVVLIAIYKLLQENQNFFAAKENIKEENPFFHAARVNKTAQDTNIFGNAAPIIALCVVWAMLLVIFVAIGISKEYQYF